MNLRDAQDKYPALSQAYFDKEWGKLSQQEVREILEYLNKVQTSLEEEAAISLLEEHQDTSASLSQQTLPLLDSNIHYSISLYDRQHQDINPKLASLKGESAYLYDQLLQHLTKKFYVHSQRLAREQAVNRALAKQKEIRSRIKSKKDAQKALAGFTEARLEHLDSSILKDVSVDASASNTLIELIEQTSQTITSGLDLNKNQEQAVQAEIATGIAATSIDLTDQPSILGVVAAQQSGINQEQLTIEIERKLQTGNINPITNPQEALIAIEEVIMTEVEKINFTQEDVSKMSLSSESIHGDLAALTQEIDLISQAGKTLQTSTEELLEAQEVPLISPEDLIKINDLLSKTSTPGPRVTLRATVDLGARLEIEKDAFNKEAVRKLNQPNYDSLNFYKQLVENHGKNNVDNFLETQHVQFKTPSEVALFSQLQKAKSLVDNFQSISGKKINFFKDTTQLGQLLKTPRTLRDKALKKAGQSIVKSGIGKKILSKATQEALKKSATIAAEKGLIAGALAVAGVTPPGWVIAAIGITIGLVIKGLKKLWDNTFGQLIGSLDWKAAAGAIIASPFVIAGGIGATFMAGVSAISIAFISPVAVATIIGGIVFFWIPIINIAPLLSTLVHLESGTGAFSTLVPIDPSQIPEGCPNGSPVDSRFGIRQGPYSSFSHQYTDYVLAGTKHFTIKGNAIDYAANAGSDAFSTHPGIAIYYPQGQGHPWVYGNHVVIVSTCNGVEFVTVYAHLQSGNLPPNQPTPVTSGTVVGFIGATGEVTGAHLHYELSEGIGNLCQYVPKCQP